MKRTWLMLLLVALVGCWPRAYRRSADLQVEKLVKDRQKQTLGYTPQVEASTQTPTKTARKSYQKIPASPIPPSAGAAIEPSRRDLDYGMLGPELLFPPGMAPLRYHSLSVEEARRPAMERLRLGPPASERPVLTMELFQAVEYAVQHSREYQTQMENLYLAALDVTLERHLFSPRPFARTSVEYARTPTDDVNYRAALRVANTVGIRQQLPDGGEIVAEGLVDFVNALNDNVTDGESAQIALTGSIPLLRGAGMVNLEPLIQSEREMVYAVREFEDFRRGFVVDVAAQYFRLLTRQQAIANRRFNYTVLAILTEQTEALYAAGRGINFLEVQRSLQQQFTAENNLIDAIQQYDSDLDDFKITLGMSVEEQLDVVPIELDITPPDLEQDATTLALKYRLDLQTAQDRVEDSRRAVGNAKNDLLPDVNLSGGGTFSNRDGTAASRIDGRNPEYRVGVDIDLPLDRLAERNDYRRSLIDLERSQRNYTLVRDSIIATVRQSIRAIRSAQATVAIQRRSIELARRRFDYANELLILGRAADSRNSVEAQNALLEAQDRYDRAVADLRIQILQFLRDTGTLRVNPEAGALGLAMDRSAAMQ